MHRNLTRIVALICALALSRGVLLGDIAPSTRPATAPALSRASADRLLRDVTYLASDKLEGRGVGTAGIDLAADYIAGQFKDGGLSFAPGMESYFQTFSLTTIAGLGDATRLASGDTQWKAGADFMPLTMSAEKAFDGNVVFAGYGITAKDRKYDDYANVDVKGKVVLVLRYEPADEKGNSRFGKGGWSQYADLNSKAKNAADHGAIAMLLTNPPKPTPASAPTPSRPGPDMLMPLASMFTGRSAAIPVIHVKRTIAEELFKRGTQKELSAVTAEINQKLSPQSTELKDVKVSGSVQIQRKENPVKNVVGVVRAKNPAMADQYIVIGAHYDHLGWGGWGSREPDAKAIHHGADDNASGTAAIIEAARILSAHPDELGRSVMFVSFTGEEMGLLGSRHFVTHPPVALEKMSAMINLDMVGRLRDGNLSIGGENTSPAFKTALPPAIEGLGLRTRPAFGGGYAPSDNTSFLLKKIPALFFFTGLHTDYHKPSDTADKLNVPGMALVTDLAARTAVRLSNATKIDFVAPTGPPPSTTRSSGGAGGASLGIIPDYNSDAQIHGVLIGGAMPGTPAEKAGLKEGDIIIQLGEAKLATLEDLSDALANGKPGETVKLVYVRQGKTYTGMVTLAERRRRD